MSGFVAIFNLGGAPVDREILRKLVETLVFRGPDGSGTWIDGQIALGHTLLVATEESIGEQQPLTLDGTTWIVADARVDGRDDLIPALRSNGRAVNPRPTDAELLLHAYACWGPAALERLVGDFSFVLWDSRAKMLFAARDHFGVKPFYWARTGNTLVLSNTLNCIRAHPGIRSELDDAAICDFLLLGFNGDNATTSFREIARLPPGHFLSACDGDVSIRRYWEMPRDGEIRYRREDDYVEHFRALLEKAVGDRLRGPRVSIFLSGGLDSTSIAAVARRLLSTRYANGEMLAIHGFYERLFADAEPRLARLAAGALGIPIRCLALDDHDLFARWDTAELRRPEPPHFPLLSIDVDLTKEAAGFSPVSLTGEAGDEVFFPPLSYFRLLLLRGRFIRLARDAWKYHSLRKSRPPLGIRSWLLSRAAEREASKVPPWLNPEIVKRLRLEDRIAEFDYESTLLPPGHRWRPEARYWLSSPLVSRSNETNDPGSSRVLAECRYPYRDVRMVEYLLALPPVPWFLGKTIVRRAMRDLLPRQILTRPKVPLAGQPATLLLARHGGSVVASHEACPGLARYVDWKAVQADVGPAGASPRAQECLRAVALDLWLGYAYVG